MKPFAEIVTWARTHAQQLQIDMVWVEHEYGPGFWKATSPEAFTEIIARATAALEFLQQYAGQDSQWMSRATAIYDGQGDNQSIESGARALGGMLNGWASQVESGLIEIPGAMASEVRSIASVDLMTQVRQLLEDKNVHPAAPIVLAGAALEIVLRAAVEEKQLKFTDKPSITTYGQALRSAKVVTTQDMKDVTQMSGLRNSAAHGEFDELSRERAGLMEQMVNIFLAKLRVTLDCPELES